MNEITPGAVNAVAWWLLVASMPYFLWRGMDLHGRSLPLFLRCCVLALFVLAAGTVLTGIALPNINYGGGGPSSEEQATMFIGCALPSFVLTAPFVFLVAQNFFGPLRLTPLLLSAVIWVVVIWLPMLGAALFHEQPWTERLVM